MPIDRESNEFQEFESELKQKLNAKLYDRIVDAKKDTAGQMVGQIPPNGNDTPPFPEE